VCGDYGDAALLEKLFTAYRITAVIHCGAFICVADSVAQPLDYYHNNIAKSITLLQTMVRYNCKQMVFSSSCAVYGQPETVPLTEAHPCVPISPYGTTKLMLEQILRDADTAYGVRSVCLRYFNAAGALNSQGLGERHLPETHSIPLLLTAARTGKPFSIFGTDYPTPDGTCIRDYIHIHDLADAHHKALLHLINGLPSDVFNLGTGTGCSVKELIAVVQKVTGAQIVIIPAKRRAGDPAVLVADARKAMSILQWQPLYTGMHSMVHSAWQFEQQHNPLAVVTGSKEKSPGV
jgi:UDP-glucose 4-epimerase